MNAIDEKIKAFTPLECVEKAVEEAAEYFKDVRSLMIHLRCGHKTEDMSVMAKNMFREAADVHVTGPMTLGKIWPEEYAEYQRKIDRALHQQIPDAIQAKIRENVANGQNPGESMTDGEYDAMAGHAGGLF